MVITKAQNMEQNWLNSEAEEW